MPQELLHGPDVVAVLEQVGGKRVPKGMAAHALRDPGAPNRVCDRALHDGFVNVISRGRTELRIAADPRRWKHRLPPLVGGRVDVLTSNREWQDSPAEPVCQIVVMLAPNDVQMRRQRHPRR